MHTDNERLLLNALLEVPMRITMQDYVGGSCEAVSNAHNFICLWFRTGGNPCKQCGFNPDACAWRQQLNVYAARYREVS